MCAKPPVGMHWRIRRGGIARCGRCAVTTGSGFRVSQASVLRLLRDEGLILPAAYQRERRQLAQRRKAAFAHEPIAPNQV